MLNYIGIEPVPDIRFPPGSTEEGTLEGWREAVDAVLSVDNCPH